MSDANEARRRRAREETARRRQLTQIEAAKVARKIMGITQVQAAEQLGVAESTFVQWEMGRFQPTGEHWQDYQVLMVEWLIAYASYDNSPKAQKPFLGSSVFRSRLGLSGHCARCARLGNHKLAHPRLRCEDVGCYEHHRYGEKPSLKESADAPAANQ